MILHVCIGQKVAVLQQGNIAPFNPIYTYKFTLMYMFIQEHADHDVNDVPFSDPEMECTLRGPRRKYAAELVPMDLTPSLSCLEYFKSGGYKAKVAYGWNTDRDVQHWLDCVVYMCVKTHAQRHSAECCTSLSMLR
jgi:hypothetical protein